MVIKGLDHGYLFTKDNERRIFKSAFSYTDNSLSDKSKIIIDGITYYFGYGNTTADVDKTDNLLNKVCTLANLAQSKYDECCLVVGLPIIQYKEKKDKLVESIMKYNESEVIYMNHSFKPNIKDVTVFMQGIPYGIGLSDGEYIGIDIGSYTINVSSIEIINGIPHIIKFDTWFDGILTLYRDIITEVNRRFDLTLELQYAEKILSKGLMINGQKEDISFLKLIIQGYLDNIFSKLKPNYPNYATTLMLLSGGGSILLNNIISKFYTNIMLLPDSQFVNATSYYNFGLQKYGDLLERRRIYA
jgi:hypothetical protein